MSEDLIERLRIKAGVIEMGEKIAWGSDSALMYEAAATLAAKDTALSELQTEMIVEAGASAFYAERSNELSAQLEAAEAALSEMRVELERLRKALERIDMFNSGDNTTLGALKELALVRSIAARALSSQADGDAK